MTSSKDYMNSLSGVDLQVGGEGMKGFYDQILPSYLNEYGKKYGAQVGTHSMVVPPKNSMEVKDWIGGDKYIQGQIDWELLRWMNRNNPEAMQQVSVPFHSFDITPQMREDITTKGMPLYQVAPPVAIGAGAAMQEEEPTEYAGGGAVKKVLKAVIKPTDYLAARAIEPPHGVRDIEKLNLLVKSMKENGWQGRPILTYDAGRGDEALTGSHRIKAATQANIEVPIYRIENAGDYVDKNGKSIFDVGFMEPEDQVKWLNQFGDKNAAQLLKQEPTDYGKGGTVKRVVNALLPKGQQAVLPAAESAANLERFLAESAVKDRLYHATPKSFSEFKPGGDNPLRSGPAIWMTPSKEFQPAAHNIRVDPDRPGFMYGNASNKFTTGTNVMPLYSSINNPLYTSELTWKKDFEKFGGSPWTLEPSNIENIKSSGFDGVVYRDKNGDVQEVLAFQPEQVKSAIGNRGTYDINEADINKAKGGQVTNDAMWIALQNKQLRKKHGN
jgi:hypothetical protein